MHLVNVFRKKEKKKKVLCLLANAACGTYVLEAATDAGLDVGASKGGHLAQLLGDLDGFVKQEAQLPLVTRVPCRRYLAEQV